MLRLALVAALAALVATPSSAAWTWPADGPVHREFVVVANPYAGGQHRGIDVGGVAGSTVRAPVAGTVSFVGSVGANGRTVTIQTADGYTVTLTHLGTTGVLRGVVVAESDAVGTIGPSGTPEVPLPYVHLGVRLTANDDAYLDPLTLLPARGAVQVPAPTPAGPEAPVEAVATAPEQRPSVAPIGELPDAGTPFEAAEAPESPAAPEAPAAAVADAALPAAGPVEAEAPPVEESSSHDDLLLKEPYELPVSGLMPGAAATEAHSARTGAAVDPSRAAAHPAPAGRPRHSANPTAAGARGPATVPVPTRASITTEGSASASVLPRTSAQRDARTSAHPQVRVSAAPRDGGRPAVAVPLAPRDVPVASPVARSRGRSVLHFLVGALVAAAALALVRVRIARNRARTLRGRDALRDNADLLRQRDAEHRQRVYDGGRRRLHPPPPAARGGHVLPHRRRRALDEGVPRRVGAGTRAVRVPGADRDSLERAA